MKLRNSTPWPDHFLRRLVSWCARQVGLPPSKVRNVQFRNRSKRSYSGHAYGGGRIVCSVGPAHRFPTNPDHRPGMDGESFADQLEALVAITAHEVRHLWQYANRKSNVLDAERRTEHDARWHEVRALRTFRENREALLAEWSVEPAARPVKSKPSVQEQRAAKVQASLDRWQRKLKLAQTKIRKLKRQAAYYDKSLAAKRA